MANKIECFKEAKLKQFKSIVESDEAKELGIFEALKRANYRIERQGRTTNCRKGHAIVSFDGIMADAFVTVIPLNRM